jgi:hypothetical protein
MRGVPRRGSAEEDVEVGGDVDLGGEGRGGAEVLVERGRRSWTRADGMEEQGPTAEE